MSLLSLVLPTIGQPDSTEDPKVNNAFTAISTWANGNIDQSNITSIRGLSPFRVVQTGTNYSAQSGDLVNVTNWPTTVTLPAPTAGSIVAGYASAPFAFSASSGTIFGRGWSGAATAPLQVGGHMILQADGTNWMIIAGDPDTGWQPFGFANGWSNSNGPASGNHVGYRKIGNVVRLGGGIQGGPSGYQAVGMAVGFQPTYTQFFVVETSYTTFGVVSIAPNGAVIPNFTSGSGLALDGISFTVD